jgi:hypothetical protein
VVLRPAISALVVMAALACAAPPTSTQPPAPAAEIAVTARWVADDGSVLALNVVVAAGTDRRRLPAIAQELRGTRPRARVIVTFFDDAAGPERYVIGHVPAADEPVIAAGGPTWLATFDLPADASTPGSGQPSGDRHRVDALGGPVDGLHHEPGTFEEPTRDRLSKTALQRFDDVAFGKRHGRERA